MSSDLQTPFDVGIVMATVARPTMAEAVRSVFAQRFGGRIQVLIGIDRWLGDRASSSNCAARSPRTSN